MTTLISKFRDVTHGHNDRPDGINGKRAADGDGNVGDTCKDAKREANVARTSEQRSGNRVPLLVDRDVQLVRRVFEPTPSVDPFRTPKATVAVDDG